MKKTIEGIYETPSADLLVELFTIKMSQMIEDLYPGRPASPDECGVLGLSLVVCGAGLLKEWGADSQKIADYVVGMIDKEGEE